MIDDYQIIARDFLNRDSNKMTRKEVEDVLDYLMGETAIPPDLHTPKDQHQ